MFDTIGLVAKHGDDRVRATLERLVTLLHDRGVRVLLDGNSTEAFSDSGIEHADRATLGRECDLVMVIAGDGTFLSVARDLVDFEVPLLGVNLGRLGFLADVMPADIDLKIGEILEGHYQEGRRFMLDVAVRRGADEVYRAAALNEAVTHKWNIARLVQFEIFIDGSLVNSQRSDGLIVATPTGSTAYALSGGGPILHPDLDALVLVPICPHTLTARPIVVGAGSSIEIVLAPGEDSTAQLTCDGQTSTQLAPDDRIVIRKRHPELRLIHPAHHDYYATLRAKLHWGKGL